MMCAQEDHGESRTAAGKPSDSGCTVGGEPSELTESRCGGGRNRGSGDSPKGLGRDTRETGVLLTEMGKLQRAFGGRLGVQFCTR